MERLKSLIILIIAQPASGTIFDCVTTGRLVHVNFHNAKFNLWCFAGRLTVPETVAVSIICNVCFRHFVSLTKEFFYMWRRHTSVSGYFCLMDHFRYLYTLFLCKHTGLNFMTTEVRVSQWKLYFFLWRNIPLSGLSHPTRFRNLFRHTR
jgi:hypothetical protein